MNILIPVDDSDIEEASISLLDDLKYWLLIEVTEGKIIKSEFYQTREEITDWVDIVVVKNKDEYVWPFMEENISVLMAPFQNAVEDIIEAYLFKELHDYNVNLSN
jgi:predicted Fe-Mo cluster-binding NifX family protein